MSLFRSLLTYINMGSRLNMIGWSLFTRYDSPNRLERKHTDDAKPEPDDVLLEGSPECR